MDGGYAAVATALDLTTVAVCNMLYEAHAIRSLLEVEGVHAYIQNEHTYSILGPMHGVGDLRVQVAARDVERAMDLLEDAELET